jgi:tripartite-type tricarboxylate transporter receptor subunit TctC
MVAHAQTCSTEFPDQVTWVVPNTPGSSYDIHSRILTAHLSQELNVEFVIDNRAGGGGLAGARRIANSKADVTTIGIVNGAMLMASQLLPELANRPDLGSFAVIGRANRVKHVWVVKKGSALADFEVLKTTSRPIVVATRDVSSTSFYSLTIGAALLRLPIEVVAGYASNRDARLAILRGEVDLASVNFDTALKMIESGELEIVVQITDRPIAGHPALVNVPHLGESIDVRPTDATALASFLGAGMLIVGPHNLTSAKLNCLRSALERVVSKEEFKNELKRLRWSYDFASHEEVARDWRNVLPQSQSFREFVLPHLHQIQGTAR